MVGYPGTFPHTETNSDRLNVLLLVRAWLRHGVRKRKVLPNNRSKYGTREREGARLVVLHKRLFKARNEENCAIGSVLK